MQPQARGRPGKARNTAERHHAKAGGKQAGQAFDVWHQVGREQRHHVKIDLHVHQLQEKPGAEGGGLFLPALQRAAAHHVNGKPNHVARAHIFQHVQRRLQNMAQAVQGHCADELIAQIPAADAKNKPPALFPAIARGGVHGKNVARPGRIRAYRHIAQHVPQKR